MNTTRRLLAAAAAIAFMAGTAGPNALSAAQAEALVINEENTAAIEKIVRDYLLKNPEIMIEVQAALEKKQREEQLALQQKTIAAASDQIFNAAYDSVVGNPEGSVTIVEFFDYNCGFCKRAMADMEAMIAADSDLRFVLKEFPILGPDSQQAHVVSMALHQIAPEHYEEFHRQLLGGRGRADESRAISIATELGVDEAKLREAMKNPEIMGAFNETYQLADRLAITGTPSYVVGDEVVFGALGRDVLSTKVANLRECDSTVC